MYNIADSPNYQYYKKCKIYLSEPLKFILTLALIIVGIILYYTVAIRHQEVYLIVLTALFQVAVLFTMSILAFRDPGFIQKILPHY